MKQSLLPSQLASYEQMSRQAIAEGEGLTLDIIISDTSRKLVWKRLSVSQRFASAGGVPSLGCRI